MSTVPLAAPALPTAPLQTAWGAPLPSANVDLTAGPKGPLVMDATQFDLQQHFNREVIPERIVHALGAGAHGHFTVTNPEIARYCKASVFKAGKKTPITARFSSVTMERGAADTARDPRGFALKFRTDDGNWDLVANNVPVFFIRDGILFPELIHSQKRDPKTHLHDATAWWSFIAAHPEAVHAMSMVMGDRGIPASYRHMNGYGNHSFVLVNEAGQRTFAKFHIRCDGGVTCLTSEAAQALAGADPDFLRRDLNEFLAAGGEAVWTMQVQLIPEAEAAALPYNILDVTKVVPHGDYPLIEVGKLVLNTAVDNFFAEVEQVAFAPGNLVPGIEPSTDRILQARLVSYADTQRHRLGPNFHLLPINRPGCPVHTHQRDGLMNFMNPGPEKHFFTGDPMTSTTGGSQVTAPRAKESSYLVEGAVGRYDQTPADPDADYVQVRRLFCDVMTDDERVRLCRNIGHWLGLARSDVQAKVLAILRKVDPEYEAGVRARLPSALALAGTAPGAPLAKAGGAVGGAGAGDSAVAAPVLAPGISALLLTSAKDPGVTPRLREWSIKRGNAIVDMSLGPGDPVLLPPAAVEPAAMPAAAAAAASGEPLSGKFAAAAAGKGVGIEGTQPGPHEGNDLSYGAHAVGKPHSLLGAVKTAVKGVAMAGKSLVTEAMGSGSAQAK